MLKTLITDGFADDEWCDADDVAMMRLAITSMMHKAVAHHEGIAAVSEQIAASTSRLEARTQGQVEDLPLWRTRLRVIIEHTHPDDAYVESCEGMMGNLSSHGNSEFRICIGGDGGQGNGRWVNVDPKRLIPHRKVSVFEVIP